MTEEVLALPAVADAIRGFVDKLLRAHNVPRGMRIPLAALGACFGVPLGLADDLDEALHVRPACCQAHPEGVLSRFGHGRCDIAPHALGPPLLIVLPARFDAIYKGVVHDDCTAVRLGFTARLDDSPLLVQAGSIYPLSTLLVCADEIDLIHARGILELKVVPA
jgi:hypothetical protein